MTILAGVIGDPISHSRSPRLHGYWLRKYGIDGQYVALKVSPGRLESALSHLIEMGFSGVNVTVPHKENVLKLAHHVSELAQRIGAANTLTFKDGEIFADNTDAEGFTWNILSGHPEWRPKVATVLGAGGASRAIIVALQERGAQEIRIINRSRTRAEALAQEFGLTVIDWDRRSEALIGVDTLVNTTSLGMTGQPNLEIDLALLPSDAVVNDIVYSPLETSLLAAARARGNTVVDGLGMLLYQAVPGFERWFGMRPEVTPELRAEALR